MAQRFDIASCYAILEVSQSATLDEVKSSYKRLALKYHPDKNDSPNATSKFQEIGNAYKAIIDHIERPTPEPNWSGGAGNFYPYDPYRSHEDDFFMDLEFLLFMFAFGYGRGGRPPPFNFRQCRPQKPQRSGETYAERAAREAREREKQAEAKERRWQQQQEKKARQTAAARERAENKKEQYQTKKDAARAECDESFKMARQKQRSAIFAAARAGRWEQVKRGIRDGSVDADGIEVLAGLEEIVPKPKEAKETLLHLAAKAGVTDVFKWLVDHGANPTARDSFVRTPFHLALQYGNVPLVDHILVYFAPGSPNSQAVLSPPPKASLLRLAIESNNLELLKIVMSQFTVLESDVIKEWRRLKDPAFANGFPISRSYGGGRGRTEVQNLTKWKEILQLLQEYVPPAFVSSDVPHHPPSPSESCYGHTQGASCPLAPSSKNAGDISSERTSKPTGSPAIPKRDKARRKRGTSHQRK